MHATGEEEEAKAAASWACIVQISGILFMQEESQQVFGCSRLASDLSALENAVIL